MVQAVHPDVTRARRLLCGVALIAAVASGAWVQPVPASARSRAAIARVTPRLTAALRDKELSWGSPIYVRIFKLEKQLEIWVRRDDRYEHFKTYPFCTYSGRLGPKLREGDNQGPEGLRFRGDELLGIEFMSDARAKPSRR